MTWRRENGQFCTTEEVDQQKRELLAELDEKKRKREERVEDDFAKLREFREMELRINDAVSEIEEVMEMQDPLLVIEAFRRVCSKKGLSDHVLHAFCGAKKR